MWIFFDRQWKHTYTSTSQLIHCPEDLQPRWDCQGIGWSCRKRVQAHDRCYLVGSEAGWRVCWHIANQWGHVPVSSGRSATHGMPSYHGMFPVDAEVQRLWSFGNTSSRGCTYCDQGVLASQKSNSNSNLLFLLFVVGFWLWLVIGDPCHEPYNFPVI